jgi:NAD-dependent SIR2 family protein deacetylase
MPPFKRRRRSTPAEDTPPPGGIGFNILSEILESGKKVVVFTGAGVSNAAGLDTFSSREGGLYERARKKFKLKQGRELFHFSFLDTRPDECFDFLASLCRKAQGATPTKTHQALRRMEVTGQLIRHYTLNIDGLHVASGLSLWTGDNEKEGCQGKTIELHGSLHQLVCVSCGHEIHTQDALELNGKRKRRSIKCKTCGEAAYRFKILMYDDKQGDLITSPAVISTMRADIRNAEAIVWAGISFEQSASCEHFREARDTLCAVQASVPCFIVNPDASNALFNLKTACGVDDGNIHIVSMTSDDAFRSITVAVETGGGG